MRVQGVDYRTVWLEGGTVRLIDQRLLPHRFEILACPTYRQTAEAIASMAVRGAGAIGAAAGYALAQAAREAPATSFLPFIEDAARTIRATRPTAHELFHAGAQVLRAVRQPSAAAQARATAVAEATAWADANAKAGERIGIVGEPLLAPEARVLTHCNAGWLAFADWGSALAPIYAAHRLGKQPFVYTTETRPRSQGAKLTSWELSEEGVPHVLIADTAVGSLLSRRLVDLVIVGADRIAANGDTANKIGTYGIAVLAAHHGIPVYVAAPRSTFDPATPEGGAIVIEERSEDEVTGVTGVLPDGTMARVQIAREGTRALNPAFDITPASLIRAFITERGLIPPQPEALAALTRAAGQEVRDGCC
jgi:methylthioribose-1-phosphate isomerase